MAVSLGGDQGDHQKPTLLFVIDSLKSEVFDAVFLPVDEAIITATEDRTIRVWQKMDSCQFWPSAVKLLPSPVIRIVYSQDVRRVFAGLDNGTVSEFTLSEDLNHLQHKRDYLAHTGRITGLVFVSDSKWILSTAKDKIVCWYSSETGKSLDHRQLEDAGTCLEYDDQSRQLFAGDASGKITILHLIVGTGQTELKAVRQLCVHEHSVTSLAWDNVKSRLFSSSMDNSVVVWDLSGPNGPTLDFQGHTKSVMSVCWWPAGNASNFAALTKNAEQYKGLVVSGGLDGRVVFWFMDPRRTEAPSWTESDVCQICGCPFYWNFKKMWNVKTVGLRQHHCRRCGKAVCDKCSPFRSTFPALGFERDVRVCTVCWPSITPTDRQSLAIEFDARHPVTLLRLEESLRLLLTVGKGCTIKIWDIKSFV